MPYRQNLAQALSRSAHSDSRRAPPQRAKPVPRQLPRTALFQMNGKARHSAARSRCQNELPLHGPHYLAPFDSVLFGVIVFRYSNVSFGSELAARPPLRDLVLTFAE